MLCFDSSVGAPTSRLGLWHSSAILDGLAYPGFLLFERSLQWDIAILTARGSLVNKKYGARLFQLLQKRKKLQIIQKKK